VNFTVEVDPVKQLQPRLPQLFGEQGDTVVRRSQLSALFYDFYER